MSTLLDRAGRGAGARPAGARGSSARSPVAAGLLAAVQAAASSLVVIAVPIVLAWAVARFSQAPWEQALQVAVGAWLLAQHTGFAVAGGHLGLVPLGLTAVPLVSCWFAGVRLARGLDPHAEAIRSGVGRRRPVFPPARALAAMVGGYAAIATAAGLLASTAGARPVAVQALLGSGLVSLLGGYLGTAAWVGGGLPGGLRLAVARLVAVSGPMAHPAVRRGARAAAHAAGWQLAGSGALLLIAVLLGWDRVALLHRALEPGVVGGVMVVLGQLLVLPNLLVWAAGFLAGPGFAVGVGSAVGPAGVTLGALPAVPVLGALPVPGTVPPTAWAVLAVPVLAGGVAGRWLVRTAPEAGWVTLGRDLLLTGAVSALGWTAAGWLSGGPAGPGRLAEVGPTPWLTGPALGLETLVGALLAAVLLRAGQSLRHRT